MVKTIALLLAAAYTGFLCGLAVYAAAFCWEQRFPLLDSMASKEDNKLTRHWVRTFVCVWIVSGALYIALVHR
jgi:high-affinity nickel permease